MFRHRVRPPTPPLDEVTAERLLGGAPLDDLPEAFRPLGQLLAAASGRPTDHDLDGSAAAAAAFVTAHDAARPRRRRRMSMAGAVFATAALALSTGTAVAATQGALPEPIQQVAHETLKVVGISVPGITDKTDDVSSHDDSSTHGAPVATTLGGTGVGTSTGLPSSGGTPAGPTNGAVAGTTGSAGGEVATEPDPGNGNGAGEGKAGNGNGSSNNGNGNGNGNGGASGGTTDETTSNLPPQSNGKGNGPPQVPPGQAKK